MFLLGSFGHFQASKSGVHRGGLNQPLVKAGFVATRISVTPTSLPLTSHCHSCDDMIEPDISLNSVCVGK